MTSLGNLQFVIHNSRSSKSRRRWCSVRDLREPSPRRREDAMAICRFEYSAKVICGELQDRGEALAPGIYVTEVNVYNPNERPVRLRKRLVLTVPPGAQQEGDVPL